MNIEYRKPLEMAATAMHCKLRPPRRPTYTPVFFRL